MRARLSGRPEQAAPDARFFEGANAASAAWRPRPDSPEVSIFTPEEEAESHARWRRAVLHRKFQGPVSGAERVGLGLSAVGLAATLIPEREPDAGTDGRAETAAQEDGEALLARKAAALGQADKAPITSKPVASTQAFTDSGGGETALSTAMSSRADSGAAAARRAAPRSSGSPLDGRVGGGGGAERAEVTVHRKAEASPGEARAPSLADGAVAFRGIAPAEIASVAIALDFVLPDRRDERSGADAEPAPGAAARADANRGAAPSEAERSGRDRADDAPPAAQAETAGSVRQGPVAEARGRDGCADSPAAAAEGRTTDAGRGTAEAPGAGRGKAADAAPTATVAKAESVPEEHGEAEAPVEAKAKDVAAEAGSGLGGKAARPQARAVEVEVSEAKAAGPERGAGEGASAPGAKAKEASPAVESKPEPARAVSEAPEQVAARNVSVVGELAPDKALAAAVSSKAKAAEDLLADARADGRQGSPTTVEAKGDAASPGTKDAGGAVLGKAVAGQDAVTATVSKVEAVAAQIQPPAQAKAIDLLPLAGDTKPGQHLGDPAQALTGGDPAQALTGAKGAKDLPSAAAKADLAATQSGTAPDANTKGIAAVEAAKVSVGAAPADAAGQATTKGAPVVAATKADPDAAAVALPDAKGIPAAEGAKPVVIAAVGDLPGQGATKVDAGAVPTAAPNAKGAPVVEGAKSVVGAVLADLIGQGATKADASAVPIAASDAKGVPATEGAKSVVGAALADLIGQNTAKAEASPAPADAQPNAKGAPPVEGAKSVVGAILADLSGQDSTSATPATVSKANDAPAVESAKHMVGAALGDLLGQGTTKAETGATPASVSDVKNVSIDDAAKPVVGAALGDLLGQGTAKAETGATPAPVLDAKNAPAVDAAEPVSGAAPPESHAQGATKVAPTLPPEAKGIPAVEGAKADAAAVPDAKGAPAVEATKPAVAVAPADAPNNGTPKTEAAPVADHAVGQAKPVEAPAPTAGAAQPSKSIPADVAAVDAAPPLTRPAEAAPPAPESLTLHVTDLWPGAGEVKAAPLVLDTSGMAVKNTEPVRTVVPPVADPPPSGAEVSGVFTPKAVDKAQPATPPDAAPLLTGATNDNGAVSPVEKSGETTLSPAKVVPPAATEGTPATAKSALASEDAGGGSGTPGSASKAPGIVVTRSADDALSAFAPQPDESPLARQVDSPAATGKAIIPDHGPSVAVPVVESFLQPAAPSDHPLL